MKPSKDMSEKENKMSVLKSYRVDSRLPPKENPEYISNIFVYLEVGASSVEDATEKANNFLKDSYEIFSVNELNRSDPDPPWEK